jgi:hypothetical protein
MENRIDLMQFEGIGDWEVLSRPDGLGYAIKTGRDNFSLEEAETIAKLPDLITELKRCYNLIDKYEFLSSGLDPLLEDSWWTATCKPDGEGQCSLEINSYEELMELVATDKVEIPEYNHSDEELLLLEGCTCGVSHEEWLESQN